MNVTTRSTSTKSTKSASNANTNNGKQQRQAHKHKRPTRRATAQPEEQHNQHEEQRKQANILPALLFGIMLYYPKQKRQERTEERTNKTAFILPTIETAGKRENTPPVKRKGTRTPGLQLRQAFFPAARA